MKLTFALLSILLLAGAFYFNLNQQVYEEEALLSESEIDSYLEQMRGLEFRADDNCQLGSKYKTGTGCDDAIFDNHQEVISNPSKTLTETTSRTNISYFKTTSSADIMKSTQHRSNFEGSGWGAKVKASVNHLVQDTETTNALTVMLMDYRRHRYLSIPASAWTMNEDDIKSLIDDPEYFYLMNGYFYVSGISTGSMFEGNLIYKSKNTTNLKQVDVDVQASFGRGPFSVSGGHAYNDIAKKAGGDTTFKSTMNATGCSNQKWNKEDVHDSHEKFQDTIVMDQKVTVTVTRYESVPLFRSAVLKADPKVQAQLKELLKISNTYLTKIGDSYSNYLLMTKLVQDRMITVGADMSQRSPSDYAALQALKVKIDDRIRSIESISTILDINTYFKGNSTKQALFDFVPLWIEQENLLNRLPSTY